MIFHSLDFLVFFAVVFAAYWALGRRVWQNPLLLAASLTFYGYIHPWFLALILWTISVDFFCARSIRPGGGGKRWPVVLSAVSGLGVLGFFKYFNFFLENINLALSRAGLGPLHPGLEIFLPVGISFYTFQSMSYVIDVYRGHLKPARWWHEYALYVTFFPQLVAGPIERSTRLLPQVLGERRFPYERACGAVVLILWGYLKKLVVADNVAVTCSKIFSLESPSFPILWVGVFAFCVQIFADFSAYSDIARGTARLLGFELMENFRHPYLAQSPGEFWRRWHISLSTWFRDYVYIPLGGSRRGPVRNGFNLVLTFFLSGLWHGASWNYVLWGLWWGGLALGEHLLGPKLPAWSRSAWLAPVRVILMLAVIHIGWLFFRETNTHYLWKYLRTPPWSADATQWRVAWYLFNLTLLYSLPVWIHHALSLVPETWRARLASRPMVVWGGQALAASVFFALILLFRSRTSADFIYFQF